MAGGLTKREWVALPARVVSLPGARLPHLPSSIHGTSAHTAQTGEKAKEPYPVYLLNPLLWKGIRCPGTKSSIE